MLISLSSWINWKTLYIPSLQPRICRVLPCSARFLRKTRSLPSAAEPMVVVCEKSRVTRRNQGPLQDGIQEHYQQCAVAAGGFDALDEGGEQSFDLMVVAVRQEADEGRQAPADRLCQVTKP